MRDIHREREAEREKQAPYKKPVVGLDPGSPGSCPGPKAGAQPLSYPGVPHVTFRSLNYHLSNWDDTIHVMRMQDILE